MNVKYYLDTNILIAYYYNEPHSLAVEHILQKLTNSYTSILTDVEFASATAKKTRIGDTTPLHAHDALKHYSALTRKGHLIKSTIKTEHLHQATDWLSSLKTTLRTLDAIHLATAKELNSTLISLDDILLTNANKLGITTLDPRTQTL